MRKSLSILLATFFVAGVFLCMGAVSSTDHSMPCPINATTADCSTASEHISYWISILSVVPSDFVALLLIAAAVCVCAWVLFRSIWNSHALLFVAEQSHAPPPRFIARHTLAEAFSNGILHPKLYQQSS